MKIFILMFLIPVFETKAVVTCDQCMKENEKLISENRANNIEIGRLKKLISPSLTRDDIFAYESEMKSQIERLLSSGKPNFTFFVPYEVDNKKKTIGIDSCKLDGYGSAPSTPWEMPKKLFHITEHGAELLTFDSTKETVFPLECSEPIKRDLWLFKTKYIPPVIPLLSTTPNIKYTRVLRDSFQSATLSPQDFSMIERLNLIFKLIPIDKNCKIRKWNKFIEMACDHSIHLFYNYRRIAEASDLKTEKHLELIAILDVEGRKYFFIAYTYNQGIDMNAEDAFELVPEFGEALKPEICSMPSTC